MATNMSRRFSTMELPTPTYQKDMTNDVRLKLAKVRARSRSFCAPSTSSTAPPPPPAELKTKKSSQLPRSSVTALTTSAKAKQRQRRSSNGRNTMTATEPSTPVHQSLTKRRQSMSSAKPVHHDAATTSLSSKTARQPQRNKSTRSTTATMKTYDGTSKANNDDEKMIKFFESDSDEDDLFFRHKPQPAADINQEQQQRQQQRRQRRTTMPPRLIVSEQRLPSSSSSDSPEHIPVAPADNADKDHDQSMWAELQELKSRLAKLEVQTPTEQVNNKKLSSICSPPVTRPSSITSVVSSPQSPLVDSTCSISNNNSNNNNTKEAKTHSQKLLQDTVLHLGSHLQQDDDPNNTNKNTAFMDTLVDLVAETITINQTLTSLGIQQHRHTNGNNISSMATLQKSSDRQINLLADVLQSLVIYRQQQPGPHQHQPVSPPLSQSMMEPESVSPKSTKPHPTTSLHYSPPSVRQLRAPPTQQCAYPYYNDNPIQNYTDDTSSQHSNLLTTSFNGNNNNNNSALSRRQQHRRSVISSSSSSTGGAPSSHLPHYIKYSDLESPSSKPFYQQQAHEHQPLGSRSVSGILHQQQQPPSYQQQQHSYYPSSVVDQHRQHSPSQPALQPIASARVHRLLSLYDSILKPATTGAAGTNASPPMSPPSIKQHQYSQLHDQPSYIDYRHH